MTARCVAARLRCAAPRREPRLTNGQRNAVKGVTINDLWYKSDRAKMIKSPPADWSAERKREYFEWAGEVVAGCRGVNTKLEGWFDGAYAATTTRVRERLLSAP